MQVLSEGEIRSILENCMDMPTGYLIHSRVRAVCETALHYMRQRDTTEKASKRKRGQAAFAEKQPVPFYVPF